jgi:hypothetical protein
MNDLIETTAADPMCYPQLNIHREIYLRNLTFAQRLRCHIEDCLDEKNIVHSEDPNEIVIY